MSDIIQHINANRTWFRASGSGTKDDPYHPRMNTLDYAHWEIHSGSHYFYENYVELGNGGIQSIEITTPDTTKWAHLLFSVHSDLTAIIELLEGPAAGTGGSEVTPVNNNRNSSNTSGLTVKTGVTAGAGGTSLMKRHIGSGTNPSSARPGEASRDSEILLKQNTIYLLKITSGAASNNVDYRLSWYEHTGN